MTRTNKLLSVALILTIAIAMIGITSDAQAFGKKGNRPSEAPGRPPFRCMDGDRAGWMFDRSEGMLTMLAKELNLTPEQQGEITKILATFRQEQQTKIRERITAHREMMKKLFTEEFDEAKVREAYQQMEAERDAEREKMREDRFVEHVKLMSAINAVLTPEQLKIVQEKFDRFFEEDRPMFDREKRPAFGRENRPIFDRKDRPRANN
ncbi:MAG: Spy/CpxP family protein refolding chaperone [Candidatus Vecturithrix sp.]|jgi:Spy/CpxP family protein refolding chaperone|nr:Spy/CpxP family protein refolding chaperone [Candidatus Vecturithrix sp.]